MITGDEALREAIRQSARVFQKGPPYEGGPFGAVILCDGHIVARARNRVLATHDPTAHAEMLAIRIATRKLQSEHLSRCALYTSCEPCPMCLAAVLWARIPVVRYANTRNDAAKAGFDDALFYRSFSIRKGFSDVDYARVADPALRREARAVFEQWAADPAARTY